MGCICQTSLAYLISVVGIGRGPVVAVVVAVVVVVVVVLVVVVVVFVFAAAVVAVVAAVAVVAVVDGSGCAFSSAANPLLLTKKTNSK